MLGVETVDVADAVRVLDVLFTVTLYLALDKHTSAVSTKCFYQLRQLCVCSSLDADSAKILVHALVTSRIDYCNGLLANASSIWTDKLQRVLSAAARVITNARKFDRGLTCILHDDLHWLDLPRRVLFNICVMVYKSLHGMAPKYLAELCRTISDVQGRCHLRSAARGLLHTPRYYLSTYGRRAFSYADRSICLEFSSRTFAVI